jgi:threonine dehydratase
MDIRREVLEAEERIRPHIRETPLDFSPYLSHAGCCQVYLKLENLQITGSFKLRGAMNKFFSLSDSERKRGVVTASSGNHGAAVAYVLRMFNCPGTIYLPVNAAPAKVEALRLHGAEVEFHGNDCVEAELFGKEVAARKKQVYISPYNDARIIGGQGTIGVELAKQVGRIGAVLVPVGGGGLISGIAGYLKSVDPTIEIIGCQPANSPVMYESIKAGRILDLPSQPTLSDGTAGGIEPGAITFGLCQRYVDDYVIVTEDEIKAAIRVVLAKHHILVEGAGALAVASFLKVREKLRNRTVVLILSGAKLGLDELREVLRE